jgi:1A family penicillin-binding protein
MRRRPNLRHVVWWILRIINLSLLVTIAGTAGLLLGTYAGIAQIIPNARDLAGIRPGQSSRVLSSDGKLLGQIATEHRQFVQLETIPEALPQAFVSIEDHDFYQHLGVDPRGIIRGVLYGRGTSTITQQLVRNVYLTPARTLSRKLSELVLAVQLERAYTKPEIMELYLNQIYFGEGAYGVQVASKTYFGKDVSELSLAECALLAGLPKRPEHYSPFEDQQRSIDRRNLVLSMMAEQGLITADEAGEAREAPLELVDEKKPLGLEAYRAPYFTNYVLREVSRLYGADTLYRGGLTIQTTLNLEMQEAAEEAVKWGMEDVKRRRFSCGHIALVALDQRTGAIKAMVGDLDYEQNQYNLAVQGGRQAGSAFKPFVYTAALEAGYTPDTLVDDSPVTYESVVGEPYTPRNYDGEFHGVVPFRMALARSFNIAAVKVGDEVGMTAVIDVARRMGIYHPMDPYLSLAIGSCDVAPLEMAAAYAVFATRGLRTEPFGIRSIRDATGRTIFEHRAVTWRALNERVAEQMRGMLSAVTRSPGTGWYVGSALNFPTAGKTGTSNEYKDAWFVGYTDALVAAVWMGNEPPAPTAPPGREKGISGATIPAPVWVQFMKKAHPIATAAQESEGQLRVVHIRATGRGGTEAPEAPDDSLPSETAGPSAEVPAMATKRICPSSAMLAGPHCPRAVQVTYDLESGGQPPTATCDMHTFAPEVQPEGPAPVEPPEPPVDERVTLPICAISEKIATARCPLVVNRTFKNASAAPTENCERHMRSSLGP